jgi:hypothetical protein
MPPTTTTTTTTKHFQHQRQRQHQHQHQLRWSPRRLSFPRSLPLLPELNPKSNSNQSQTSRPRSWLCSASTSRQASTSQSLAPHHPLQRPRRLVTASGHIQRRIRTTPPKCSHGTIPTPLVTSPLRPPHHLPPTSSSHRWSLLPPCRLLSRVSEFV